MNISYQKPTKTLAREYLFQKAKRGGCSIRYFDSKENLNELQEKILLLTDSIVNFLEGYILPKDVKGEAKIEFRLYEAEKKKFKLCDVKRRRYLMNEVIGDLGFPSIEIETNLGMSSLSIQPSQKSHIPCLEIKIKNKGIAEKAVKHTLGNLEKTLDSPSKPKIEIYKECFETAPKDSSHLIVIIPWRYDLKTHYYPMI